METNKFLQGKSHRSYGLSMKLFLIGFFIVIATILAQRCQAKEWPNRPIIINRAYFSPLYYYGEKAFYYRGLAVYYGMVTRQVLVINETVYYHIRFYILSVKSNDDRDIHVIPEIYIWVKESEITNILIK